MKKTKKAVSLAALLLALSLTACGKSEEAQAVDDQIAAIGTVSLDSEDAIAAAEDALSGLSEEDREQVENQAVLETLQALTGDEEQAAALESLQEYGLLDEDGNLRQTSTVTLDGKEMTLQQVREYLEDCGEEDLQKTVSIDGAEVTLENLQIMMEIEEVIARLRETYFSYEAPELTSEQETALNSLTAQLQ